MVKYFFSCPSYGVATMEAISMCLGYILTALHITADGIVLKLAHTHSFRTSNQRMGKFNSRTPLLSICSVFFAENEINEITIINTDSILNEEQ